MAYLTRLVWPECRICHKPAVDRLFNTYNAAIGDYCAGHAKDALTNQSTIEAEERAKYGAVTRPDGTRD